MKKLAVTIEIAAVLTFTVLCIWTTGTEKHVFGWLAGTIVAIGWLLRKDHTENWGIFLDRLIKEIGLVNWKLALFGTILFLGKMIYGKHLLGYVETPKIVFFLFGYLGWALFQLLILNGFLTNRLKECGLGNGAAAFLAGTIFGALHWPNLVLVPVTFLGGIALSYVFLRGISLNLRCKKPYLRIRVYSWITPRNLYVLAAIQVLVAALIYYRVSPNLHHNFRVGPSYFTWTPSNKITPH